MWGGGGEEGGATMKFRVERSLSDYLIYKTSKLKFQPSSLSDTAGTVYVRELVLAISRQLKKCPF